MKKSYLSIFYGKIIEETWLKGSYFIPPNGFHLADEHIGMMTSVGFWSDEERRYERIAGEEVFFFDVLSVEFEVGYKVKINKEVVIIKDVIHRLDGSIEYHTDKIIEKRKVKIDEDKLYEEMKK